MAHLSNKIEAYLGRKINFLKDVVLQNDGSGAIIKEWNVAEAQPTEEQLNAVDSQANDAAALELVHQNRKKEYPSIEELVVALYDSEDRAAIEAKRAEVKAKYPK